MAHADRHPAVTPQEMSLPPGHAWGRLPALGAGLGLAGIVVSALLGARDPGQFYFSWLVAFLFWLSIALGALFFVLTHFVTKASWSVVLRRQAENVMGTLPVFALLFVPIVLGMHDLYHWTHADAVAHDPLLAGKSAYLNTGFFLARAAACLAVWALLASWFARRSVDQDRTGDVPTTLGLIRYSAPALFAFALTVTVASIDWMMSLDPHWYSTMFGVYYFAGCLVGFFAFMNLLAAAMQRAGLFRGTLTTEHFHDLGKLLFGFTVFWAYIAFSQYFLIWYGNIPEETVFYARRMQGSWETLSAMLAWGHFGVPFLFLMSRHAKRRTATLVAGSVWVLVMHLIDLYWIVMPVHRPAGAAPGLVDLAALVAVGGVFLAALGWLLRRRALIPVRDPRLAESLGFENA
jgi:hypothetical protein